MIARSYSTVDVSSNVRSLIIIRVGSIFFLSYYNFFLCLKCESTYSLLTPEKICRIRVQNV